MDKIDKKCGTYKAFLCTHPGVLNDSFVSTAIQQVDDPATPTVYQVGFNLHDGRHGDATLAWLIDSNDSQTKLGPLQELIALRKGIDLLIHGIDRIDQDSDGGSEVQRIEAVEEPSCP